MLRQYKVELLYGSTRWRGRLLLVRNQGSRYTNGATLALVIPAAGDGPWWSATCDRRSREQTNFQGQSVTAHLLFSASYTYLWTPLSGDIM